MTIEMKGVTSDWLAVELDGNHAPSRENEIVAASQILTDGMVVSKNTNGQIQVYGGATDEVATGVYVGDSVTTKSGETAKGVVIARNAKVVTANLTFKSGLTQAKQTAALADLAKLHITTVRSA